MTPPIIPSYMWVKVLDPSTSLDTAMAPPYRPTKLHSDLHISHVTRVPVVPISHFSDPQTAHPSWRTRPLWQAEL